MFIDSYLFIRCIAQSDAKPHLCQRGETTTSVTHFLVFKHVFQSDQ